MAKRVVQVYQLPLTPEEYYEEVKKECQTRMPNCQLLPVCASRFEDKPKPGDCLVFEDAPNGIESALAAGMQTIMVPSVETPKEIREKAHVVIDSLDQAPLELFGLPAMEKCSCKSR
ncbi:unnamed protein product [Callosobruchus maculatus]|uniref:Uncharacterized protein n=1 Tax=Callosobruchus maculatus TaxID=64391 RepID=A0A653CN93_CALMS|nr:unnamed protein product [Callosobruchus maculatus]